MSSVVPVSKEEFLQFCAAHEEVWTTNSALIGLTSTQITAWKDLVSDAQAAYGSSIEARDTAKAKTMLADDFISQARASTAELVRLIKNFALASGDPKVYGYAQIPAPTPASELPPPAQPTDLKASLNTDGSLKVSWKVTNAKGVTGVVYIVRRKIGAMISAPWEVLALQGGKQFIDDSLPLGVGDGVVQYQVQGQRGTQTGPVSGLDRAVRDRPRLGRERVAGAQRAVFRGGVEQC